MRNLIVLIILTLTFSCNRQDRKRFPDDKSGKKIVLAYDEPHLRLSTFYKLDTLDISTDKIDDSTYVYKSRSIHDSNWGNSFQIDLRKEKAIYTSNKETYHTKFVDKKIIRYYKPETKNFFVYRIITYSSAADSQGLFYWSPEFGIIMWKSLTFHNFVRFEYLNDEEKNKTIRDLCFFIISDNEFYNLKDWEEISKE